MANILDDYTGTNGTVPSGYTVTPSGRATIQSNALQVNSPTSGTYVSARASRAGLANGDLTVDMLVSTKTENYPEIMVRSSSATSYVAGYSVVLLPADNLLSFRRWTGASTWVEMPGSTIAYTIAASTNYRIRFRFQGSTLQFKIWNLTASESEPGSWLSTVTDSTLSAAGTIHAISSSGGTAGARTATFDNLSVTDLDMPTVTPRGLFLPF